MAALPGRSRSNPLSSAQSAALGNPLFACRQDGGAPRAPRSNPLSSAQSAALGDPLFACRQDGGAPRRAAAIRFHPLNPLPWATRCSLAARMAALPGRSRSNPLSSAQSAALGNLLSRLPPGWRRSQGTAVVIRFHPLNPLPWATRCSPAARMAALPGRSRSNPLSSAQSAALGNPLFACRQDGGAPRAEPQQSAFIRSIRCPGQSAVRLPPGWRRSQGGAAAIRFHPLNPLPWAICCSPAARMAALPGHSRSNPLSSAQSAALGNPLFALPPGWRRSRAPHRESGPGVI